MKVSLKYVLGLAVSAVLPGVVVVAPGCAGAPEDKGPAESAGNTPEVLGSTAVVAKFEGSYDGKNFFIRPAGSPSATAPGGGVGTVRQALLDTPDSASFGSGADATGTNFVALEQVAPVARLTHGVASGEPWNQSVCGGLPSSGVCVQIFMRNLFANKVLTNAHVELTELTMTGSTNQLFVPASASNNQTSFNDSFYGISGVGGGKWRYGSVERNSAPETGPSVAWAFHGQASGTAPFTFTFKGRVRANVIDPIIRADVATGTTDKPPAHGGGTVGNGAASGTVDISSTGRYVAFASAATNLVPGTVAAISRVYRADLETSTVELVSTGPNLATPEACTSTNPSISLDGSVISFESTCQFDAVDTNTLSDVYVRRLAPTPGTIFASRTRFGTLPAFTGIPSPIGARRSRIAPNGNWVVFESDATNLVLYRPVGRTNIDIYRRDVSSLSAAPHLIEPMSRITNNATPIWLDADSLFPDIGSFDTNTMTVFETAATNAVTGDANGVSDVFAFYHSISGSTPVSRTRCSVTDTGAELSAASTRGFVSSNGVYCGFQTTAAVVASKGANGLTQVYARNRNTPSTVTLVSRSTTDGLGNGPSSLGDFAGPNGRFVSFLSSATNLVSTPSDGTQVYVTDRSALETPRFTRSFLVKHTETFTVPGVAAAQRPAYSEDARFVAFLSAAPLVPGSSGTHAFRGPATDFLSAATCAGPPATECGDRDGDGLSDETETNDSDPWTDPDIFNGMNAQRANHCHAAPTCAAIDTLAEVDECTTPAPRETKNQAGGWNWEEPPTADICDTAYGFHPDWSVCGTDWQVDFQGFIKLENGGQHCFRASGDTNGACGSIFFNNATTGATSAAGSQCFDIAAGVYPIRWFYETAGGPKTDFKVAFCFGGTQACEPTAPVPSRLLRTQYAPGTPICDPQASVCTDLCPCGPGQNTCVDNRQCKAGLICGESNGSWFDLPRGTRVCWNPGCEFDPVRVGCGFPDAPCGPRCEEGVPCSTHADCSAGERCGLNNGTRFRSEFQRICWPEACETDPLTAGCGTERSLCGFCPCQSTCASKQCGDAPDNGCGGLCDSYCANGQTGCTADHQCPVGSVCAIGQGPRLGHAPGTNVCLPRQCTDPDVTRQPCGPGSPCGECLPCVPQCGGRECGRAPNCEADCGSVCADGLVCNAEGRCASAFVNSEITVRDPFGNHVPVPPPAVLLTEPVGAVSGAFFVSDRGSASYTIPIQVPPGRVGMQPRLGFKYTSTKSNGALGVGWSLEGLSTISRCQRTVAQDGGARPVGLGASDRFCLDGQRLVAIDDDDQYGADGTEYRTEIDTFARIISLGSSGAGPSYFKVWTKSGEILFYGSDDDSSIYGDRLTSTKRAWALARIEDRSQNFVSISYRKLEPAAFCTGFENQQGRCNTIEIFPDSITYTGHGTTPADRSVRFSWSTDRPDRLEGFTPPGNFIFRSRRLESVETFVSDRRVRRYELGYELSPGGVSRMTSIKECGFDPSKVCKPATQFSYINEAMGFEPGVDTGLTPGVGDSPRNPVIFLDVDGDGREDFLSAGWRSDHRSWYLLYHATGSPPFFTVSETNVQLGRRGDDDPPVLTPHQYAVFDYNGDGRDDIFDVFYHGGKYRVLLSTGTAFFQDRYLDFPVGLPDDADNSLNFKAVPAILFDVDGDGQKDVFHDEGEKTHSVSGVPAHCDGGILYYPRIGDFFSPSPQGLPKLGPCTSSFTTDVDGDGVPNLLRHNEDGARALVVRQVEGGGTWEGPITTRAPFGEHYSKEMDLNGDGLRDHVQLETDGSYKVRVLINSGNGFAVGRNAFQTIPHDGTVISGAIFQNAHVTDLNGDGKSDLIRAFDEGNTEFGKWMVQFGSERGLSAPTILDNPRGAFPRQTQYGYSHRSFFADVDGDGNKDLLFINGDSHLVVYRGRGARSNLLTRIEDGLGKRIDIGYAPDVAGIRTYTAGSDCRWPTRCLHNVGPLVATHSEAQVTRSPDGLLRTRTVRNYRYRYWDGREGLGGRGWLGFARRSIEEKDGAGIALRTFDIGYENHKSEPGIIPLFPYAGRINRVWASSEAASSPLTDGSFKRRTETDYTWVTAFSAAGRPFPVLSERETRVLESTDTETRPLRKRDEFFDVDAFGNVKSHFAANYSGNGEQLLDITTVDRIFEPTPAEQADWLIGLLRRQVATDTILAETNVQQTRTATFDYYPNGHLKSITREPEDDYYRTITTLIRDNPYGNVDQVIRQDAQGNARGFSVEFDAQDVFPVRITNALQQTTQVRFGPAHGELQTLADPNGIYEESFHDAFGRVRIRRGPGTGIAIDYQSAGLDLVEPLPVEASFRVVTSVLGGPRTEQEFDGFGRLVRSRESAYLGSVVDQTYWYDDAGRLARISRPHLPGQQQGVIFNTYDRRGRLVEQKLPDDRTVRYNHATRVTWAGVGPAWVRDLPATEMVSVQNPRGYSDLQVYDQRGNLITSVDPLLGPTHYRYESFNQLNQIVDARGNVTTIRPDRYGRVEFHQDPDMGVQTYTYTAFDELKTHVNGNIVPTTYFYDTLGRLFRSENPESTRATEWIYGTNEQNNEIGRLIEAISPPGPNSPDGQSVRYSYEPRATVNRGLLQTITRTIDGEPFATSFEYDDDSGRLSVIHYPNANGQPFVVQNAYDDGGNLTKVCKNSCTVPNPDVLWEVTSHDQGYRIGQERYGNAITNTYTFEPLTGRLADLVTRRGNDVLRSLHHEYDDNNNITLRANQLATSENEIYHYDELDRLTRVDRTSGPDGVPVPVYGVAYNNIGNIDFKSDVGDYTYRTDGYHPHTVENAGGVNYQYDGNGNQTVRQGPGIIGVEQLIDYTSFNMPESVTFGANPNASRIELEYDASQTRILKRTITPTGEKTNVYAGELYERRQSTSGFEHQYLVYAGGRPIAQVSRTGTTDTRRFLHDDRLGSVEMVTSGTGTVEHSQKFGVFGRVASGAQPGGATGVRRGFTGHEHDADLGLINMRGRVYDPILGRFLTADPFAGGGQGLNRYSYVGNNPTNFVDPSGFERQPPDFGPGAKGKDGGPTSPPPPGETFVQFNWYFNSSASSFSGGADVGSPYTLTITYGPPGSGINDAATTDFAPSAENEHVRRAMPNPFDDLAYVVLVHGEAVQNGLLVGSATLFAVAGAAIVGPAIGLGTLEGAVATAAGSAGTTLSGGGALVGGGFGLAARGGGDVVRLYHGSVSNYSSILKSGLDVARTPTWVTTSRAAAENAIGPGRVLSPGQGLDRGIIESVVARAQFERLIQSGGISSTRTWPGFGGGQTFPENVLRSPEAIQLFNTGIIP